MLPQDLTSAEIDAINDLLWHYRECGGLYMVLGDVTESLVTRGLVSTRQQAGETVGCLTDAGWDVANSLPYNRPEWVA